MLYQPALLLTLGRHLNVMPTKVGIHDFFLRRATWSCIAIPRLP